jgi:hypothetical protein
MGDGGTRRRGKACESGCQMVDISREVQLSGIPVFLSRQNTRQLNFS